MYADVSFSAQSGPTLVSVRPRAMSTEACLTLWLWPRTRGQMMLMCLMTAAVQLLCSHASRQPLKVLPEAQQWLGSRSACRPDCAKFFWKSTSAMKDSPEDLYLLAWHTFADRRMALRNTSSLMERRRTFRTYRTSWRWATTGTFCGEFGTYLVPPRASSSNSGSSSWHQTLSRDRPTTTRRLRASQEGEHLDRYSWSRHQLLQGLAHLIKLGRSGPKAGASMGKAARQCTYIVLALPRNPVQYAHAGEARVGERFGQVPPEVLSTRDPHDLPNTKFYGPNLVNVSSQATGFPGKSCSTVVNQFSQFSHTNKQPDSHPNIWPTKGWSTLRWPSLSTEMLRHTVSDLLLQWGCLLCLSLALLCTQYRDAERRWRWHTVRVIPGAYRRRRIRAAQSELPLPQCKRTLSLHAPPVIDPDPKPSLSRKPYAVDKPALTLRYSSPHTYAARFFWVLLLGWFILPCGSTRTRPLVECPHVPKERATTAPNVRAYGQLAQQLTPARKPSFKRAQLRVLRDGTTRYRGREHNAQSLAMRYIGQYCPRPRPLPSEQGPSLRLVSWNAGGLHSSRYQELLCWMERQTERPIHAMCIQETHWASWAEYSNSRWAFVHSGSGSSSGGILFIICRRTFELADIKCNEIIPGRALHVRLPGSPGSPAADLLGIYQHSWNPAQKSLKGDSAQKTKELLQRREQVWTLLRTWPASVPRRNSLIILGDCNATLKPLPPHVGQGVASHQGDPHPDQGSFQQCIVQAGLTAVNTWGKHGRQSGTFIQMSCKPVQIDYVFVRAPFQPQRMQAKALHDCDLVPPTGMRHVPISCHIPFPTLQVKQAPPSTLSAKSVRQQLDRQPELAEQFRQAFATEVARSTGAVHCIDKVMRKAWDMTLRAVPKPPACEPKIVPQDLTPTIKSFWQCKQVLRKSLAAVGAYSAPVVWNFSQASASAVVAAFPQSIARLRSLFRCWVNSVGFASQDRFFKKKARERKQQLVNSLIEQADRAEKGGISQLQTLAKQMRPKTVRRTVHFRSDAGVLLSPEEEIAKLVTFFSELYQSHTCVARAHNLQHPLHITESEVAAALRHMSSCKALPRGHVPAALWKVSQAEVIPLLCRSYNEALKAGLINFPAHWHRTFLVLIPKQGKSPTRPESLRPIALLPAEAKLLARIAAERLKPVVQEALLHLPQFSYSASRQTADCIDRVISHCYRTREIIRQHQRTVFTTFEGRPRVPLAGGTQLSLDLSRAYDMLPRECLESSLALIGVPRDLIVLILYIHNNALVVLEKHGVSDEVRLGRGIRQGCGLSPLLWLTFTISLHKQLGTFLSQNAISGYADDYHVQWDIRKGSDFRVACNQVHRILEVLTAYGMKVSRDKTAIILALRGKEAAQLVKTHTIRKRGGRFLCLRRPDGDTLLPIRTEHTYLGVKIGYGLYERDTANHRLQQSWIAFHRLRLYLKHKSVPLRKRVLLWQSSVWSIVRYGIVAVGLDEVSAAKILSQTMRQLRMVARSPSHVTKESNTELLQRLGLKHPIAMLLDHCVKRVDASREALGHLQPPQVQHTGGPC